MDSRHLVDEAISKTGRHNVAVGNRAHRYIQLYVGCFYPPDVNAILNIPLRTRGGDDSLAWAFGTSGVYS